MIAMGVSKVVFGAVSIMDISDSTVTPETLAKGKTAYDKTGEKITGTAEIGVKLYAVIGVTYPEGSTLTCTNGTELYTAGNTSGQWVFAIPYAGTWTVTCIDGTKTKSQGVQITVEGQLERISLSYELLLFDGGDITAITGGWQGSGHNWNGTTATSDGGWMTLGRTISLNASVISGKYDKSWILTTKNKIDLSGYSKLKAMITGVTGSNVEMCVVNQSQTGVLGGYGGTGDPVASVKISRTGEVTLPFEGLNSSYFLGFYILRLSTSSQSVTASKVWLE